MSSEHWSKLGRSVVPESRREPESSAFAVLSEPLSLLSESDRAELNEGLAEIARHRREAETDTRSLYRR